MEYLESLDQSLFHLINVGLSNPYFDIFFPAITDLHKTNMFRILFVPFLLLAWIGLYRIRGLLIGVFLLITLGINDAFGGALKRLWIRPRPFNTTLEVIQRSHAGGYSFPSNHAMNMFCAACFLSAFFPRFRAPLFLLASCVAFSRVYNGVHFPLDVLVGMLMGSVIGIIGAEGAGYVIKKVEQGFHKKRRDQRNV